MDRVSHIEVVGLSLEGEMLGREGDLCGASTCNTRGVFMFDISALVGQAFKFRLRTDLQDQELMKVVHDCLTHQ